MVATEADTIAVGCAGLPQGLRRERFFEHVDLLETDALAKGTIKPKTLRRWRQESPNAMFSLTAPPAVCAAPGAPPRAALDALAAAVEALGPDVVLLRTAADLSPSAANRAALQALAQSLPDGNYTVAWEPQGLWAADAARGLADDLGWVVAFDPLQRDVLGQDPGLPDPARAYFRITGLGTGRRRVSDDDLYELAERARGADRAWVVFANLDKHRDARRLRALLDS